MLQYFIVTNFYTHTYITSSVERQKGTNAARQCSAENYKGATSVYKVFCDNTLLVLNGTLLNSINALLAISQQYNLSMIVLLSLFYTLISEDGSNGHNMKVMLWLVVWWHWVAKYYTASVFKIEYMSIHRLCLSNKSLIKYENIVVWMN